MARQLLLCCIVQLLLCIVYGQAPLDFHRDCTHPTNFRITPPAVGDNVCVLMDSRYYRGLLGNGGVWRSIQTDTNGGTWVQGRGGICSYQVRTCTYILQMPQENYLLTQFIHSDNVNEVWIDLGYRFSGGGYLEAFDLLYFETDTSSAQASANPENYQLIERVEPSRSRGQLTFSFETSGKKGFYIAVRENGTCLTLNFVRVYSYCCKERTAGLIRYPRINAPAQSSLAPIVVTGQCLTDSCSTDTTGSPAVCMGDDTPLITSVEVRCQGLGRWDSTIECFCHPGFSYEGSGQNVRCEACPLSTYKSSFSNRDRCSPCPMNSVSNEGSSCCHCSRGFYRAKDETVDLPCSAPPSKPLNMTVVSAASNSITVAWDSPVDDGGRSDISYSIQYQATSVLHRGFLSAGKVELGSARMATINQLKPVTEYTIRVIAENGVSDQDPDSQESRACLIVANTAEGVPGKINVFQNSRGNTFTWQPPQEANGVITGFVCTIFREGESSVENVIDLGPFEFCFSPIPSMIPAGSGTVWIQVAARTAVGVGEPSKALPLRLEEEKRCPGLAHPINGEVVVVSELVGGVSRYFCDSGYRLAGASRRVCQSDTTWSEDKPTCEPIICGVLRNPANGGVILRGGRALNSIAEYSCNQGYQLSGDSLRFCQIDSTWTGPEPTCVRAPPTPEPVTCPPCPTTPPLECPIVTCPTCPTPPPCPTTPPRECPIVTCPTCPTTTPCPTTPPQECPIVTCPTCPTFPPCPTTPPRECPTITCPTCPPPTACPEITCATTGNQLIAEPDCGAVEPLVNGMVMQTDSSVGSVVTYSCDNGYVLTGARERVCQSLAAWTESAPTCERTPQMFMLGGQTYLNNTLVRISDIGEDNNALLCVTDKTDCCRTTREGEFYYPGGQAVGWSATNSLYRNRGHQVVRLNRRNNALSPLGRYRCDIPDSNGVTQSIYINIATS